MLSHTRLLSVLLLLSVLILSGCAASQPPAIPTLVPTIRIAPSATPAPTATPAPSATPTLVENAYPYPVGDDLGLNSYPYPFDGGAPGGSPAIDNRSRVQVTLIELAPDPENADLTRLRVLVNAVEAIPGMPDLLAGLLNMETDFYARNEDLPELKAGDSFTAEVSLRGDEHGAKVFVISFER